DLRLMRVSGNNGIEAGRGRIEIKIRKIVQHVEGPLVELHVFRAWQFPGPWARVDVSADRDSRGDLPKPIEHLGIADIPGMNDEPGPTQCGQRLRSQQAMRVRNNADEPCHGIMY